MKRLPPATFARLGHDGATIALVFAGFGLLAVGLGALLPPDEDFNAPFDIPFGVVAPALAFLYFRWKQGRIYARAPRVHERELLEAPRETRRRDLRWHVATFGPLVLLAVDAGVGLFVGYLLTVFTLCSLATNRVYASRERERGLALFRKRRSWREVYLEVPISEAP